MSDPAMESTDAPSMGHNGGPTLAADLIHGAKNIAAFYGKPEKWGYQMLEARKIPGFRLAGRWTARRSTLLADIERRERGETAA